MHWQYINVLWYYTLSKSKICKGGNNIVANCISVQITPWMKLVKPLQVMLNISRISVIYPTHRAISWQQFPSGRLGLAEEIMIEIWLCFCIPCEWRIKILSLHENQMLNASILIHDYSYIISQGISNCMHDRCIFKQKWLIFPNAVLLFI